MEQILSEQQFAVTGWLGTLSEPLRAAVLRSANTHVFRPSETVYYSGADGSTLWGIGSGTIKMYISAGEEHLRFCHAVGPGYWFGELELLLNLPRLVEMRASGNARLLCLKDRDLHKIAKAFPEIWLAVARLAATNEALAVAAADDLMLRDPRKRLAATLLRLCGLRWDFQDRPHSLVIPVTLLEIAEIANLSRSVAAKLLSALAANGTLEKEYGRVRISHPDRLEEILQH